MKSKIVVFIFMFILFNNKVFSLEKDCNQFKKLSAKYIECNARNLKEKTNKKVSESKIKLENTGIKEKIKNFKDSNTLTDLIKN